MIEQRHRIFTIGFNIATILLWGSFLLAFLWKNSFVVPWSLVDLYLIVLVLYSTDKEIRRWRHDHHSVNHRGEAITFGWAATYVLMLGVQVLGGEFSYTVPPHMGLATGGVVLIYIITQYLKAEYHRKR